MMAMIAGMKEIHSESLRAKCTWSDSGEGYWETSCGHEYVINDGSPHENQMKFCAYCGGKLVENKNIFRGV